MLKSVYLGFRKVKVQRVTVVEFGMYNKSGDGVGCHYNYAISAWFGLYVKVLSCK